MSLWRLPRLEGHADRELNNHVGIECDGSWVGDHDLDPLGSVQGQREIQAVVPGRFKHDLCRKTLLRDHSDQFLEAFGIVGQIKGFCSLSLVVDDRCKVLVLTSMPT